MKGILLSTALACCAIAACACGSQSRTSLESRQQSAELLGGLPAVSTLEQPLATHPSVRISTANIISDDLVRDIPDCIGACNNVTVDQDGVAHFDPPSGGLAWALFTEEGFGDDLRLNTLAFLAAGPPYYIAVANYFSGTWVLHDGTLGDNVSNLSRRDLLGSVDEYVSPGGRIYIAVLAPEGELAVSQFLMERSYVPLPKLQGLHSSIYMPDSEVTITWQDYSDPRADEVWLYFIPHSGPVDPNAAPYRKAQMSKGSITVFFNPIGYYKLCAHWSGPGVSSPGVEIDPYNGN